jgi:hypothetical protein
VGKVQPFSSTPLKKEGIAGTLLPQHSSHSKTQGSTRSTLAIPRENLPQPNDLSAVIGRVLELPAHAVVYIGKEPGVYATM